MRFVGVSGTLLHITEKMAIDYRERALLKVPAVCIAERKSNAGRVALDHLEREGFAVRMLAMGADAVQRVAELRPLLIFIEMTSSRRLALNVCRGIRCVQSLAQTPVILVSANASEEERVQGLESGADDYFTESSSGREVLVRVQAVMRRFARQALHSGVPPLSPPFIHSLVGTLTPTIRRGDIEIDPAAMRIAVRGSEIETTNLEFRLLYYLVHNQARVLTRDQLLDAVWGTQYVELRSVDACIRRLRRKIEPDPLRPTYLKTIRGAGYSLQVAA
jgi:DNA-binding response OmpR family regulator